MSWLVIVIVAFIGLSVVYRAMSAQQQMKVDQIASMSPSLWKGIEARIAQKKGTVEYKPNMSYTKDLICSSIPNDANNFHVPGNEFCDLSQYIWGMNLIQDCYRKAQTPEAYCLCARKYNCANATPKNWG